MAKLSDYKVNNGSYNMLYDTEILENSIKNKEKEPVIRLYGWSPACVSLGRNQKADNVNIKYCNENKIDIVRRITGGRGLFHDDELTYSFVCPVDFLNSGNNVIASYKEISSAVIQGFKSIGINLEQGGKKKIETSHDYCMLLSTGADLSFNGRKLIGSAQYRKTGYILQHGSVLFSYNKEKIEQIFNEKIDEKSLTFINEINDSITKKDVINAMLKGFKDFFSISYSQI